MWKDVPGYEAEYEASNDGELRSKVTGKEQLSYLNRTSGYLNFALYKNGKKKMILAHRLIAMTFLPNPNHYPQINHKDEDKLNNCAENLEWCTASYNANYGTRLERCNGVRRNNTKNMKPVIATNLETGEILKFPSANEAGRNGFDKSNIINCCNKKRYKSHKGYKWMWA